jgi:sugar transferase (PEP-CTERM system associated)
MSVLHLATWRPATLIVSETALITAAVCAGLYARLGDSGWATIVGGAGMAKSLLIAGASQLCLYYADLYDLRSITDRRDLVVRLVRALGATSLLLAVLYFWFPALIIERGVFLIAASLVIPVVAGWRVAFEWLTRRIGPHERLLLVGTGPAAVALAAELHARRQELGVEIVGFVDPDPARVGELLINPGIIGTLEDIPSIVRARGVDRVVVSIAEARGTLPMDKLLQMKLDGATKFDHLATVYEEYTGKIAVENLRPSWLVFSSGFRKTSARTAVKRAIDVSAASLGLLLAGPVMLLVAAAVKLTSRGPALYHQQRVGQYGRVFTLHKFRSMCVDAEAATGAVWAAKAGDPRITRIGGVLRRTRLDELPQLWNILAGDMSLIGPRPERPEFVTSLTREIPFYGQRHVVRPGLTGWAQVRYSYGASVEDALEKLQYDLYYIKNMSIALDMYIAFETLKTVILRRGAA